VDKWGNWGINRGAEVLLEAKAREDRCMNLQKTPKIGKAAMFRKTTMLESIAFLQMSRILAGSRFVSSQERCVTIRFPAASPEEHDVDERSPT